MIKFIESTIRGIFEIFTKQENFDLYLIRDAVKDMTHVNELPLLPEYEDRYRRHLETLAYRGCIPVNCSGQERAHMEELYNGRFEKLNLRWYYFNGLKIRKFEFDFCDMKGIDFRGTCIDECKMVHSDCRSTEFCGQWDNLYFYTDLRGAKFNTRLFRCTLVHCDIRGIRVIKGEYNSIMGSSKVHVLSNIVYKTKHDISVKCFVNEKIFNKIRIV